MFVSGKVGRVAYGEGETIGIGGEPLAKILENFQRRRVHVTFAFSETFLLPRDLLVLSIAQAMGEVEAKLAPVYSELTGFLYVEDEGKVGGHDLLRIFSQHEGEYGCIVVQKSEDGPIVMDELVEVFEKNGEITYAATLKD